MAEEEEPSAAPSTPVAQEPGGSSGDDAAGFELGALPSGAGGGAASTSDLTQWRASFEAAVAANEQETKTVGWQRMCREYEGLFSSYSASLREISALKAQLEGAREAAASAHVGAAASAAASATGSLGSSLWGGGGSSREAEQLQKRLIDAQDALLVEREKERKGVSERMRLVEANQRLSEEAQRAQRAAERLEAQRAALVASERSANAASDNAAAELKVVLFEVAALREESKALAASRDDLLHTTSSLSSVRLSQSLDIAGELNAANAERAAILRGREVVEGRLREATARAEAAEAALDSQSLELLSLRGEVQRLREASTAAAGGRQHRAGTAPDSLEAPELMAAGAAVEGTSSGAASQLPPLSSLPSRGHSPANAPPSATSTPTAAAAAAAAAVALSTAKTTLSSGVTQARSMFSSLVSSAFSGLAGGAPPKAACGAAASSSDSSTSLGLATGYTQIFYSELPIPSKPLHRFSLGSKPISSLIFLDPAGHRLAAGEGSKLNLVDVSGPVANVTGTLHIPTKGADIAAVAAGPRALFAGSSDGAIFVWDAATRQCLKTVTGAHSGSVASLAYLAMEASSLSEASGGSAAAAGSAQLAPGSAGGCLLSAGTMDTHVRLWDVRSAGNRPIRQFNARSHVNALCIGTEGAVVHVGCMDGRVKTFDLRGGAETASYAPQPGEAGASFWCTGLHGAPVAPRQQPPPQEGGAPLAQPTSLLLATYRDSAGSSLLRLLDAATLAALPSPPPFKHPSLSVPTRVSRSIFSPCAYHAIAPASDGRLYCFNTLAGSFEVTVGGGASGSKARKGSGASAKKPAPGEEDLLFAGAFAELREEEGEGGAPAPVGHGGAVTSVVCAAEGGVMASGDAGGIVCTWESVR